MRIDLESTQHNGGIACGAMMTSRSKRMRVTRRVPSENSGLGLGGEVRAGPGACIASEDKVKSASFTLCLSPASRLLIHHTSNYSACGPPFHFAKDMLT